MNPHFGVAPQVGMMGSHVSPWPLKLWLWTSILRCGLHVRSGEGQSMGLCRQDERACGVCSCVCQLVVVVMSAARSAALQQKPIFCQPFSDFLVLCVCCSIVAGMSKRLGGAGGFFGQVWVVFLVRNGGFVVGGFSGMSFRWAVFGKIGGVLRQKWGFF